MSTKNSFDTTLAEITAEDVAIELYNAEQTPQQDAEAEAILKTNPYVGIAAAPFSAEAAEVLLQPVPDSDIEIRPDGLIYLPEIKYRRILNRAFGPGAWSLLPIDITVADDMLYYRGALFVHSRFVSEAIGEQQYFAKNDRMSYATAAESAKSNCLMRCCKDLGIASECWDPSFVRRWLSEYAVEVWCENVGSNPNDRGKKRKMWRKKDAPPIDMFPWREKNGTENGYDPGVGKSPSATMGQEARPSQQPQASTVEPTRKAPTTITFRQVKRLKAIAAEYGWQPAELQELLDQWKLKSPEDVRGADYDKICAQLEDKDCLDGIREIMGKVITPATAERRPAAEQPAEPLPNQQPREATVHEFISEAQVRTLTQIIARHGWGDGEVADVLLEHEVTSLEKIPDHKFSKIMGTLVNKQKLQEIRSRNNRR